MYTLTTNKNTNYNDLPVKLCYSFIHIIINIVNVIVIVKSNLDSHNYELV